MGWNAGAAAGAAGATRRFLLQPGLPVVPRDRPMMDPWRWRRVASVFLVYLGYAASDMVALHDNPLVIAYGAVLLVVFSAVYLITVPLVAFLGRREYLWPALLGMVACIAAYVPVVGGGGLVMTVYLSVALVLLARPIVSIPLVLAIAAVDTWLPQHVDWWQAHGAQWSLSAPVLLAALTMYGVRAGARSQAELSRAHQEIERLAKEQERLRIARDLHDLLGHALTTITVKAELASKLADRDPARAADEMAQVAALGRQGLADVRATVAGYREVSLVTELAAARQVLAAAGIRAELPASVEEVPGQLRELFGWVVREGVTNAVRHSGAHHLRITLGGACADSDDAGSGSAGSGIGGGIGSDGIELVDDGRGPAPVNGAAGAVAGSPGGAGLRGLAERVAAAGGRLETGPASPSAASPGFRLRVVVPSDQEATLPAVSPVVAPGVAPAPALPANTAQAAVGGASGPSR
ncbi:putative two-component system sensor kinase [Frankia canadensis]|uniref:Putative two-component system sensor kinase n=1 Tax=Frankia canadensis TaxID=1836972 RepID=A0A2I2KKQ9_9ACTN|nr:histidine kinase [Frankia canadensis]SNQ46245.1 putative two-component system sensor kinase [Frankia canadensis]SOU53535.1 putative two-component system sensor kinase [Frankia canadensis]